ncbi:hypothetical protein F0U61_04485 [Archangium violaceum]|uniref:SitI6 family double-CXXCG motif immunity protein n=1 Tax=Archangium violaceum TaxID=83451 RepID=UPI002B318E41|nr:hypothetical protein F0U61_04485 [Archangium violaceum]
MRYFRVKKDRASGYTGDIDATHRWKLPGVIDCPACQATWGDNSRAYPSVDLTPIETLADFEEARAEPIEEYERLSELVRPFLPPGIRLQPGAAFGPLVGKAQGRFGSFTVHSPWWPLVQRDALDRLKNEGLQDLKGCPTQLRFRQRASPEFFELELLPVGHAHPDCLPPDRKPPCPRCGRFGLRLPDELLLDAATLPVHLNLFRLEDFSVLICTERFVEACQRLELDGVTFHPLQAR